MKCSILSALGVLVAGSLLAADPTPKEVVTAAAKKLGGQTNYTWVATVAVPEDAQFKPGPTEGKTEKDGFTTLTLNFFDNKIQAALKGGKGAAATEDGSWKTAEELEEEEGPGRFMGVILRASKRPADEVAEVASYAKDLKKDGEVYAGELTEEGAKTLQTLKLPGGEPMVVNEAKGSARFWLKDGFVTKYEVKLKGKMKFGDNEYPNDRTTTVEIKDVNKTKVEVSEAAKKKLP